MVLTKITEKSGFVTPNVILVIYIVYQSGKLDHREFYLNTFPKVWAMIMEFLGDMEPEQGQQLGGWCYDNMCHLKVP